MNKKRILVIGYLPPPTGGLEAVTETIINSRYLNDNFKLFFLRVRTRSVSKKRGKLGILNLFYNFLNIIEYLAKLIMVKPACVYLSMAQNKFGFFRDSLFIIIGKVLKKEIYVHFHGEAFDQFYNRQAILTKSYIRLILRRIDKLLVLGNLIKDRFKQLIPQEKIYVIYNCIGPAYLPEATSLKDNKIKNNVLFIGYISQAKGAPDLVKAASIVIKNFEIKPKFTLIGPPIDKERNITFIANPNGGYSHTLDLIEKNNLSDFIKIHTDISQELKNLYLFNSDIFAFPSYSEGFALVVLEAMAAGLPVIMSRVGGLSEILEEGKNCFFIAPGDYEDLSEKIIFLLKNNRLRLKMGENNRLLVKDKFSLDKFETNLAEIWSKK